MGRKYKTVDAINGEAKLLRMAGDKQALYRLAEQCGLDRSDVEDYLEDGTGEFATPLMAAAGWLKQEGKRLKLQGVLLDWLETVLDMTCEDEKLQAAVLQKSLGGLYAELLRFAFENKIQVPDEIVNQTKVRVKKTETKMRSPLYIGFPDKRQVRRLVREYYIGGGNDSV